MTKQKLIVPDTSVLISKKLTELIEKEKLKNVKVIIPKVVIDELQAQASRGKEIGFIGLEEIKELRKSVKVEFVGRKATLEEIKLAKKGSIDSIIRDVAKKYKATLYTRDLVQALVAEVYGVDVVYLEIEKEEIKLEFLPFLTKDTMSLHFKVNCVPLAKRGKPGKIRLEKLRKEKLTKEEFESLVRAILTEARREDFAFIEFEEYGAMVLQIRDMRIAITRPPFSSAEEITIVRPIVKLSLDDYKLSNRLKERIEKKAEGILIAGPPGSGKSTLAASLAEFYLKKGKIVKTMESPRDLQVSEEITQYAPLQRDFGKTADILLLVRPDYTIFDEMRTPHDFRVFADLRLAGVGMVGVVHASHAIDAIQRFINKVELGMLQNIIDTIIFVKDGEIKDVYSLNLVVRVPTGMKDSDLARPLIEVRSFETNELKYEIYTYGEETVVVPVKKKEISKGAEKLAIEQIRKEISRYDSKPIIEFVSDDNVRIYVNRRAISKIIGKKGKKIEKLERKLGLHIDVFEK
jgi:ATPase